MPQFSLSVNGKSHQVQSDPDRPLLDVLREDLNLTGAKFGCGEGRCGACGVLADGKRIFSCLTPVSEATGKPITTVEGLASGDDLHPVQRAFLAEGAFQCGYCTAGMMIAAAALLKEKPAPTEADIRQGMDHNLCRCCGYTKIAHAVGRSAELIAGGGE